MKILLDLSPTHTFYTIFILETGLRDVESTMNMQDIRDIARERGCSPGRLRKIELVRTLQREEGCFDCYARAYAGYCDQPDCLWREDCLSLSARHGKDG